MAGGAAPALACWSLLADVSEAQLKKLCRKRGLDHGGNKHALLARLKAFSSGPTTPVPADAPLTPAGPPLVATPKLLPKALQVRGAKVFEAMETDIQIIDDVDGVKTVAKRMLRNGKVLLSAKSKALGRRRSALSRARKYGLIPSDPRALSLHEREVVAAFLNDADPAVLKRSARQATRVGRGCGGHERRTCI